MHKHKMNRFLFMGDPSITRSLTLNLIAQRGVAFFAHIEKKYRVRQAFEKFPLYFLRFPHLSDTAVIEYQLSFKPLFHWTLVNRAAPPFGSPLNRVITPSLTRSLTPSLTRPLTQLLTRSFIRSTSFIHHLHEEKRETQPWETANDSYLIHQTPDAAAEPIRTDIFNYFSTLSRITRQESAVSINRLITRSLTRSLTPSVTRSLTQLLTRSFHRSTSFITLLHEEKREIKSERVKELEREQERSRTGPESPFKFPIADTNDTYLIHQSPGAAAECIRTDIFNYFSTLSKITSQESAVSINRLITRSLTRSLTPSVTRSLTQLLTRSFSRTTSFITLLHEEKREIKSERVKELEREQERSIEMVTTAGEKTRDRTLQFLTTGSETHFTFPIVDTNDTDIFHQSPDAAAERIRTDIFNYFSTLSKVTSQASASSINRLITSSLTRSLTPSLTRSLTQLLTRSFNCSTSFITHLHEQEREVKSAGSESLFTFPLAGTRGTSFIHQSPDAAAERIRTDIFNYFSTLNKITRPAAAASINRLITQSLTRSFTQLLTRSFNPSTSFITHLHDSSPFTLHQLTASSSTASFTTVFTPSSARSFNHTTAFITYLHKGRKEKDSRVEMGTAAAKETRAGKLEMKKPAPRTYGEALREKAPLPEMPGFERERLELRYTSALYLAGKQDTQVPHAHKKGAPLSLSMSAKEWLSSRTVIANIEEAGAEPSSIEDFLRNGAKQAAADRPATAQRIIDLSSLAGENDSNRHPVIKHAPPPENSLSEKRIKKIEQTITTHTKQLETRMKDAVTTSMSSVSSGASPGGPQGMNLSGLTDNIYNLLMERVKRERRMMGY